MKFLLLLLALAAVAHSKSTNLPATPSVYGYLAESIKETERIFEAEKELIAQQRIIGGSAASLGQFPYQAGLLSNLIGNEEGRALCGASLVSPNRLISAAHCWFDGENQAWRTEVVLGSTFLLSGGWRQFTTTFINHPDWMPFLIRNDVGVIYLNTPVSTSYNIAPIALPSGSQLQENFAGDSVVASGYGLTTGPTTQTLNHVTLNVISNLLCTISYPLFIRSSNICTSGVGTVGTCRGDSGGPIAVTRNNQRVLIGVTSFGSLDCAAGNPSAFARVTSFMDFFNQHL